VAEHREGIASLNIYEFGFAFHLAFVNLDFSTWLVSAPPFHSIPV
jgi:hypothetical protein